jgi:hypothetical protein
MSQIILVFNVSFLRDGRILHASLQPHDAKEIGHANPETISHPVMGPASKARPMVDDDRTYVPSAPKHKSWKKSVHVVKKGKAQESVS